MITLWSIRYRVAIGWYFRLERECLESTAQAWIDAFKRDEPEVTFILSVNKPNKKLLNGLGKPLTWAT